MARRSPDALGRLLGSCYDSHELPIPLPAVLRHAAAATTCVSGVAALALVAAATPAASPRSLSWDWSWAGPGAEPVRRLALYDGHALVAGGLLAGCAVAGVVTALATGGWRRAPAWQHFCALGQVAVGGLLLLPLAAALLVLLVQLVVLLALGALIVAALFVLLLGALSG